MRKKRSTRKQEGEMKQLDKVNKIQQDRDKKMTPLTNPSVY